jgi:hypothetical protein
MLDLDLAKRIGRLVSKLCSTKQTKDDNMNMDFKTPFSLIRYNDIGYDWTDIELEEENSSKTYFLKEDEKLMEENLKRKEFLERLEELKMDFKEFKDYYRKYYQAIKVGLDNLNDVFIFCGKKNRVNFDEKKKELLEKGFFEIDFGGFKSERKTEKIYLGNYIVREKTGSYYYFETFNEKEFLEKYQEKEVEKWKEMN